MKTKFSPVGDIILDCQCQCQRICSTTRKKILQKSGFSDFICNFALSLDFLFLFATRRYVEFFDMARPWAAFVAQDIKSIINYSAAELNN